MATRGRNHKPTTTMPENTTNPKTVQTPSSGSLSAPCCVSSLPNIPALSIRQPWAWAITTIGKDIENRTWSTNFRGEFLIHAGKGCTRNEYIAAKAFILNAVGDEYKGRDIRMPGWKELQRGGVIGIAEIVDCVETSGSKWFMGTHGFVIRNARTLPFTPCNGALGFFNLHNRLVYAPAYQELNSDDVILGRVIRSQTPTRQ